MDYDREYKAMLCQATWALARDAARASGASEAGTLGGRVPLSELLDNGATPWARDGWEFVTGDPFGRGDGRLGAIVERGLGVCATFPVYGREGDPGG